MNNARDPSLPGIFQGHGHRFFSSNCPPDLDELTITIEEPAEEIQLHMRFNCIKLHGSCNWRSGAGAPTMVIGDHKALRISASPLLVHYHQVFDAVLCEGDVRLMVIGYGFADEHINAVIARAVKDCGLRVFIWNTRADVVDWLRTSVQHGQDILSGLITTESRRMIEVLPSDQRETESYQKIISSFFA